MCHSRAEPEDQGTDTDSDDDAQSVDSDFGLPADVVHEEILGGVLVRVRACVCG